MTRSAQLAILTLLSVSCGESPVGPPDAHPLTLALVAGSAQSQVAGYPLADTLVVRLADASGAPAPFAPITVASDAPLAHVTMIDAVTRADGTARLAWRLGVALGAQQLTVAHARAPDPLVITATATSNRFRSVAGGDALLCAVDLQGRLGCVAPIADADRPPRWAPTLDGPYSAVAINHLATGVRRGCAATVAGPVHCFDVAPDAIISNVATVGGAHPPLVSLATATGQHDANPPFCGLAADGSAWCWGDNRDGALGDGSIESRPTVAAAAVPLRFTRLDVGAHHACGLDVDGVGWCWGRNDLSQLGAPPSLLPMPQAFKRPGLLRYHAMIPIRDSATCGLARDNGGVWCWGEKTSLGIGALTMGLIEGPSITIPVFVTGLVDPIAIGVVDRATVAISANGRHAWWGRLEPGVDRVEAFEPQAFLHWVPLASLAMPVAEGAVCGTPPGHDAFLCVRLLTATGYSTHQPTSALAGFGMPFP